MAEHVDQESSRPGPRIPRWSFVLLFIALAVGVYMVRPAADSPTAADEQKVADAGTAAALPRLIDLGADKCIPCKMMTPILEELKNEQAGKLSVEFIDVWKDRDAGAAYGIKMIPTQIFLAADGTELFRHEGFFAKEDILAKWRALGFKL